MAAVCWPRAAPRAASAWAHSLSSARHGLSRARRLRLPAEFAATLKSTWRGRDGFFSVYAIPNPHPHGRLGLVVSRKASPRAVVRNRIKRQVREAFRQHQEKLEGLDIVVVASTMARTAPTIILRASLQQLWNKIEQQCRKS